MLTDQDIQKLTKVFSTKEDSDKASTILLKEIFSIKKDLESLREENKENFNNITTSIDSYAKKSDMYFQEMLLLANKVDRQEKWIHQLAEKMGVQLKY